MTKNMFYFTLAFLIFFLTGNVLFGQSYTTITPEGIEIEYTRISEEQFNRIRSSHEQIAVSVFVDLYDDIQTTYHRVIRGARPRFSGESYWYIRANPSDEGEIAFIRHRNGDLFIMDIIFYNRIFSDTINLSNNRSEYIRLINLGTSMVRNAR